MQSHAPCAPKLFANPNSCLRLDVLRASTGGKHLCTPTVSDAGVKIGHAAPSPISHLSAPQSPHVPGEVQLTAAQCLAAGQAGRLLQRKTFGCKEPKDFFASRFGRRPHVSTCSMCLRLLQPRLPLLLEVCFTLPQVLRGSRDLAEPIPRTARAPSVKTCGRQHNNPDNCNKELGMLPKCACSLRTSRSCSRSWIRRGFFGLQEPCSVPTQALYTRTSTKSKFQRLSKHLSKTVLSELLLAQLALPLLDALPTLLPLLTPQRKQTANSRSTNRKNEIERANASTRALIATSLWALCMFWSGPQGPTAWFAQSIRNQ